MKRFHKTVSLKPQYWYNIIVTWFKVLHLKRIWMLLSIWKISWLSRKISEHIFLIFLLKQFWNKHSNVSFVGKSKNAKHIGGFCIILALEIEIVDLSNDIWSVSVFQHHFVSKFVTFWYLFWSEDVSAVTGIHASNSLDMDIIWVPIGSNSCNQDNKKHWKKVHFYNFLVPKVFPRGQPNFWFSVNTQSFYAWNSRHECKGDLLNNSILSKYYFYALFEIKLEISIDKVLQ